MSKCKIEFAFSRGDTVRIKELERPGKVESLWFGDPGKQYSVRYFYNGKAETVHFYESELELDDSSNSKKDD